MSHDCTCEDPQTWYDGRDHWCEACGKPLSPERQDALHDDALAAMADQAWKEVA